MAAMIEAIGQLSAMTGLAVIAGAVFFVGDIYVLGLIFKRLFVLVQDASSGFSDSGFQGSGAQGSGAKLPAEPGLPAYSPEEPAPFEERSTEAAPSKTQIILLVVLKFILLVPVLIALLYSFADQIPALFAGMLVGLVIVCAALYLRRRRKPLARG